MNIHRRPVKVGKSDPCEDGDSTDRHIVVGACLAGETQHRVVLELDPVASVRVKTALIACADEIRTEAVESAMDTALTIRAARWAGYQKQP